MSDISKARHDPHTRQGRGAVPSAAEFHTARRWSVKALCRNLGSQGRERFGGDGCQVLPSPTLSKLQDPGGVSISGHVLASSCGVCDLQDTLPHSTK